VTTHDLPTVAGLWTGADLDHQRAAGVDVAAAGTMALRRLAAAGGDDPVLDAVVVAVHAALGRAPCRLRVATLEDGVGVRERPNLPGTVGAWPNWSLALPVPLEEIETHPTVQAVGEALGGRGGAR
jgi:4-alpha-glucanotransferase